MSRRIGYKVVATVKSVKGHCSFHKPGDTFEVSMHNTAGMCGLFYHDIFPWILALQIGGEIPWGPDKDATELECMDRHNAVRIELKRVKE